LRFRAPLQINELLPTQATTTALGIWLNGKMVFCKKDDLEINIANLVSAVVPRRYRTVVSRVRRKKISKLIFFSTENLKKSVVELNRDELFQLILEVYLQAFNKSWSLPHS
jgi:hypothetical protein